MKTGKQAFTPKARLIQILGEQLIKDASVGLVELVKNSYDADATSVQVSMVALNTPDAKIIIRDNGCGMDTETFLNKWMNPASGHKEKQKAKQERTALGRLPLGEKGVGRFAAQQIGNTLTLISKVKDSNIELIVSIDWREFDVEGKDLNDIEIDYAERSLIEFQQEESGVLLEISHLKSNWTEADIKRVANTLKRMKSPFKGATDFDVILKLEDCPEEFLKYENLEISDILEKAHYKLFGIVDAQGVLEFEYYFFVPGYKPTQKNGQINLVKEYSLKIQEELICGSFIVNLHNYDKSPEWLQKSGVIKKDIEELCGVSIYRDGIRILPYGERGDDWLELDKRRVQDPTGKIDNKTIIGMIEVNQIENQLLKDKTNREGLIENLAFHQFRELVLATIQVLEHERSADRPKKEKKQDYNSEPLQQAKTKLSTLADKLAESHKENNVKVAAILENSVNEITTFEEEIKESFESQKQEKETLFTLAGTGLAAERFTHEFARLVRGALDALGRLKKFLEPLSPKIKKELDLLYSSLEALRNDIRLLGPMFYVKKVANEKELDIRKIIENTIALQERWLEKESIQVEIQGESFIVKMREGSCMQIFNNLIDNAIFWLSRKSELDKRHIRILLDTKTSSVFVSDSGSGVISRYKDKIFEPFFTTKIEDGRGLGLYIAKEILEEKNWDITLVSKDDYPGISLLQGASFKITFTENHDE